MLSFFSGIVSPSAFRHVVQERDEALKEVKTLQKTCSDQENKVRELQTQNRDHLKTINDLRSDLKAAVSDQLAQLLRTHTDYVA